MIIVIIVIIINFVENNIILQLLRSSSLEKFKDFLSKLMKHSLDNVKACKKLSFNF